MKECCLCGKSPAGADGYCQQCYDELARIEYNGDSKNGGKDNE